MVNSVNNTDRTWKDGRNPAETMALFKQCLCFSLLTGAVLTGVYATVCNLSISIEDALHPLGVVFSLFFAPLMKCDLETEMDKQNVKSISNIYNS